MKYVRTKQQMADMLTKASFTAVAWKELCELCCIGPPAQIINPGEGSNPTKPKAKTSAKAKAKADGPKGDSQSAQVATRPQDTEEPRNPTKKQGGRPSSKKKGKLQVNVVSP